MAWEGCVVEVASFLIGFCHSLAGSLGKHLRVPEPQYLQLK